jgi:iron complex outermembrane receptor protein
LGASSLLALLFCEQAHAEAAPTTRDSSGQIEEVIVTARKVEESLQTTPVSVQVANAVTLERANVVDASDLTTIAPGLISGTSLGSSGIRFSIRGQSPNNNSINTDQSVGTYFDGVYVARSAGGLFNLVDVQRVEVLKGPQGTLFGRNTTGGAISVISNKPTGDLEGSVKLRYGNYNTWEATGVVNAPLVGDQLAIRAVYQHGEHDGYAHNLATGGRLGDENLDFFRVSVLAAPEGQPWRLLLEGDYTSRKSNGKITGLKSYTPTGTNAFLVATCSGPTAAPACPYKGPAGDTLATYSIEVRGMDNLYDVYNNSPLLENSRNRGFSATFDYDLNKDIAFKSITAWRDTNNPGRQDIDGTPYLFVGNVTSVPTLPNNNLSQSQFSEEVQLNGVAMDSRLNWIVGGFYFNENGRDLGVTATAFPLSQRIAINDVTGVNKSYAGYGQFTYKIVDTVRFTGGLRYTKDTRNSVLRPGNLTSPTSGIFVCALDPSLLDPGTTCSSTTHLKYDYVSYTASLDWQATPDAFLYIKTSRANRAGGINTLTVAGSQAGLTFQPERVTDYEVGSKLDLLDRRLRVNLAAFYSDYTDIQRNIQILLPNGGITSGIQNAATAEIKGAEFEIIAKPIQNLTLNASGTYLDAHYKKYTVPTAAGPLDVSDTPFGNVPRFSYLLAADYEVPLSDDNTLNFHVDWTHRTSYQSGAPLRFPGSFGALHPDVARIPGYGLLGAQVSLQLKNNLEFSLYGRNLLQERYFDSLLSVQDTALGITAYNVSRPRTYGVTVEYKF